MSKLKERIEMTIKYGSIFYALESKFFTPSDLLIWYMDLGKLNAQSSIMKIFVSHKAIYNRKATILSMNEKFLTSHYYYAIVASMTDEDTKNFPTQVRHQLIGNENGLLSSSSIETLSELMKRDDWEYYFALYDPYSKADEKFKRLVNASWSSASSSVSSSAGSSCADDIAGSIGLLLKYDLVDLIPPWLLTNHSAQLIIDRCLHLQCAANDYWKHVMQTRYQELFERLKKCGLLFDRDKIHGSTLSLIKLLFPSLFPESREKIMEYSPFGYVISRLPRPLFLYFLGFDFAEMREHSNVNVHAIQFYSSVFPNSSKTEFVRGRTKNQEFKLFNTTDTLMEELENYSKFDLFYISSSIKKDWCFSRPEWKHILERKENPYTREKISGWDLLGIQAKLEIAEKTFNLPKSAATVANYYNDYLHCAELFLKNEYTHLGPNCSSSAYGINWFLFNEILFPTAKDVDEEVVEEDVAEIMEEVD